MKKSNVIEMRIGDMALIYENYMREDFPENELKPLKAMKKMYEEGTYTGYVLLDKDVILAYWFIVRSKEESCCLLDYLAVAKELRGCGYGSHVMEQMKQSLNPGECLLIEVEDPKKATNEEELEEREKRLHFYEKNGVITHELQSEVFGASYQILSVGNSKISEEQIKNYYTHIYKNVMMSEKTFEKYVKIF